MVIAKSRPLQKWKWSCKSWHPMNSAGVVSSPHVKGKANVLRKIFGCLLWWFLYCLCLSFYLNIWCHFDYFYDKWFSGFIFRNTTCQQCQPHWGICSLFFIHPFPHACLRTAEIPTFWNWHLFVVSLPFIGADWPGLLIWKLSHLVRCAHIQREVSMAAISAFYFFFGMVCYW